MSLEFSNISACASCKNSVICKYMADYEYLHRCICDDLKGKRILSGESMIVKMTCPHYARVALSDE